MSKTVLADGFVKIEIGDEVLTLTPREDRVLGGLMDEANLRGNDRAEPAEASCSGGKLKPNIAGPP